MTQLEVPNISFTHYLDLLKRRTWHVVMVSVLGLLVGGTVALMIPRYYVAYTTVQINRPVLDSRLGTPSDPMEQVVSAARDTVGRGVETALERLKWPEAISGSEESQRAFRAEVRRRIFVQDVGTKNRGRGLAVIRILYQDLDGQRAADMANTLREIWLEDFVLGLKTKAEADLQSVMNRKAQIQEDLVRVANEIAAFEKQHGINPMDALPDARSGGVPSTLSRAIGELEGQLADLDQQIAGLTAQRQLAQATLETLDPTEPVPPQERISPAMQEAWAAAQVKILVLTQQLNNIKEAHEAYAGTKKALAEVRNQLAVMEQSAGDESATRPNPLYEATKAQIKKLDEQLLLAGIKRKDLQKRLAEKRKRQLELADIYVEYGKLRGKLRDLEQLRGQINAEYIDKERTMRLIAIEKPYEELMPAFVPARPTEPNPYMLALIGCVVGLAVAVGLVFLIDFLQMTFKSVSDVEAGLGLPVLGSMSYLETAQELDAVRDRRARLTLFAVLFLALLLTVVTIYYIAPTNLPQLVTDFFDFLLGPTR